MSSVMQCLGEGTCLRALGYSDGVANNAASKSPKNTSSSYKHQTPAVIAWELAALWTLARKKFTSRYVRIERFLHQFVFPTARSSSHFQLLLTSNPVAVSSLVSSLPSSSAWTDSHSYASAVKTMSSSSSGMNSTPRRIVIDDTNPRVQYVGPWSLDDRHTRDRLGNFGEPFQGSLHGVVGSTASFSFSFEGA